MKSKIKLSVSSVKFGKSNENKVGLDLYINGKSVYTPGLQKQVYSFEKITDNFLCALCEENSKIIDSTVLKGILEFERCEKRINDNLMRLDDSVSLIASSVRDLLDINESYDTKKTLPSVSYLCLFMDGEYGVCINTGLQSAYYFDSVNMVLMTPSAEKPDKLKKMGIISDAQAELVKNDLVISASNINISDKVKLVKDGTFIIVNNNMAEAIDEDIIINCLSALNDPEQIGNRLIKEALKTGCEGEMAVTVIKLDFVQSQVIDKKKTAAVKASSKTIYNVIDDKIKNVVNRTTMNKEEKKNQETKAKVNTTKHNPVKTNNNTKTSSAQNQNTDIYVNVKNGIKEKKPIPGMDLFDDEPTKDIPDIRGLYSSMETSSNDEKVKTTERAPYRREHGKNRALTYFFGRIFTVLIIVGVLSGVVIGLVNLASLIFSDNIIPPVYSDQGKITTISSGDTGSQTTESGTTGSQTTQPSVTSQAQTTTITGTTPGTSTPALTTPVMTDEPVIIHTVKTGETLSHISLLYYNDQTKYYLIMEENNMQNDRLQIGQQLRIPPLPKTTSN